MDISDRKTVKVSLGAHSDWGFLGAKLSQFEKIISDAREQVPDGCSLDGTIKSFSSYDDTDLSIELWYERPETEEEFNDRTQREAAEIAHNARVAELKERHALAKLKAKYEA